MFLFSRFRTGAHRESRLSGCKGFRVDSPEGEIGTVEEVRFVRAAGRPAELVVRDRAFASPRLVTIPIEDVHRIIPSEGRVVLRGRPVLLRYRLIASAAFAATGASLLLPFVSVTLERRAEATGVDLVTGTPSLSGTYVHAAYEGEVEQLVDMGHVPAIVVFASAIVGSLVAWFPGRRTFAAGLFAAVVGLAAMWALFETTTPGRQLFASSDHRYGFWLAGGLYLVSGSSIIWGLRRARGGLLYTSA